MAEELASLRAKLARLEEALEDANSKKMEAAEVGMMLLDKQKELEASNRQLLAELEIARADVDAARLALEVLQSKQKAAAKSEQENEQSLLDETEGKEDEYRARIEHLEADLRAKEQELERSRCEQEQLIAAQAEMLEAIKTLEEERNKIKAEMREIRAREQRLASDFSELEDENIQLQKTVANLRGAQVEFEAMKVALKGCEDEIYVLSNSLEESEKLNKLAQKQVDEALVTAQQEREQRLALKRELDAARNAEHMSHLNSMLVGLETLEASQEGARGESLFNELNTTEEDKIRELEADKERLVEELKDREKSAIETISSILAKLGLNNTEVDFKQLRHHREIILDKLEKIVRGEGAEMDKKMQRTQADLRSLLLLAGERTAQLATAQALLEESGRCHMTFIALS